MKLVAVNNQYLMRFKALLTTNGKLVLSNGVLFSIQTTLKARLHVQQEMVAQNKLDGIFEVICLITLGLGVFS